MTTTMASPRTTTTAQELIGGDPTTPASTTAAPVHTLATTMYQMLATNTTTATGGSLWSLDPSIGTNGSGAVPGEAPEGGWPQALNLNVEHGNGSAPDLIQEPEVQLLFCLLYVAIFVVGVFGNVLVCYVVLRNKAMRSVTNLFIMNLALSDILLCLLAVPVTPSYSFLRRWIFGTALCHMMAYVQGCSVYISSLTLTSIAIDRFFVIIYPFHPRMKLTTCVGIILGIWCFSVLVTLPYGLYIDHYTLPELGNSYCEESWPSEHSRKVFSTLTSSLQFVLPFLVISFCYVRVSIKLNDRARRKPGTKTSAKERLDRARKKRTNRMLIAMVAVFGVSWLPLNLVNILNDFYEHSSQWSYYNLLFFLAHSVAMTSTCYNPFLYAWLNENFRKEFKQVLPCFQHRQPSDHACHGTKWRSERTCNGMNETMQESLLPSTCLRPSGYLPEIIPRGPTAHEEDRIVFKQRLQTDSVDSILLSEVVPPHTIFNGAGCGPAADVQPRNGHGHHPPSGETIRLPSGVLETPFDGDFGTKHSR